MKMPNWFALIAVSALVLAACGGDGDGGGDDETTTTAAADTETTEGEMEEGAFGLPVIDPLDVDSNVTIGIAGSSTVFPLSTAVMTQWIDEGGPEYTIESIGSGGGLESF